ncbi:MAG: hypothetical protein P8Y46_08970 [Sulfurovaceae bacterium]
MFKLLMQTFTEKGLYIAIGVIGFISGLAGIFIDVNSLISIKWLLFVIIISLISIIALLSLLNKIVWEKQIDQKIKIIKYSQEEEIIILKSSQNISINSILTLYINKDGYEKIHAVCIVLNVQENGLISAKVKRKINKDVIDETIVKKGILKTTLPYSVLFEEN